MGSSTKAGMHRAGVQLAQEPLSSTSEAVGHNDCLWPPSFCSLCVTMAPKPSLAFASARDTSVVPE